jgi:hypothetical protein
MPRRRKLVKAPGRPVEAPAAPRADTHGGTPQTEPQAPPRAGRRRKLVRGGEHPAVAQFAGYPEAQERVRQTLATQPDLKPSAFSWSPLRMGGPLCAAEAERVSSRKSIRVPGLTLTASRQGVCSACYADASKEGLLVGGGWAVTLYEPAKPDERNRFECLRCGKVFHGEASR